MTRKSVVHLTDGTYEIEDRFPDLVGTMSGALTTASTRSARAVFHDSAATVPTGEELLPFRPRYLEVNTAGRLVVRDAKDGSVKEILVHAGTNVHRVDQILVTGSDPVDVDIRD